MSQLTSIGPELPLPRSQAYRDWLGVGASVLCAIHCAAMPFVVGFLPLLGLSFLADPSFHQWMVAICLALALLAFVPGWRRHHRLAPAIIGLAGLGLITFAAFAGPDDCCPTPCDGSATANDGTMMTVAMAGPAPCATTMVKDDGSTIGPSVAPNGSLAVGDKETCAASCCPEDGTVVTAGTSEFMRLVWLWMTPIGGLILVVAHLTNHRLSAHCKRTCCASVASRPSAP